ncbi:MAG TPA: hypothetical protein DCW90_00250 [Lachnospiraceae bacterium]|nr:hypothetical protein [Lachnospiraceae bacterium]
MADQTNNDLSQYLNREGVDALVSDIRKYIDQECPIIMKPNYSSFPSVGVVDKAIYVDKEKQRIYRWDDTSIAYVPITQDITGAVLNGGNVNEE